MKFWKAFVFFVLACPPAVAAEPVTVSLDGGLLNVTVSEPVPLGDVLTGIADQYGATIEGAPEDQSVGPVRLVGVSLHQALSELLQKRSFSVRYADGAAEPSAIIVAGAVKRTASLNATQATPEPLLPNPGPGKIVPQQGFFPAQGANPMLRLLSQNPLLQMVNECGDLLQKPENRGKKSETLVTAKGEPCPPNIIVPTP